MIFVAIDIAIDIGGWPTRRCARSIGWLRAPLCSYHPEISITHTHVRTRAHVGIDGLPPQRTVDSGSVMRALSLSRWWTGCGRYQQPHRKLLLRWKHESSKHVTINGISAWRRSSTLNPSTQVGPVFGLTGITTLSCAPHAHVSTHAIRTRTRTRTHAHNTHTHTHTYTRTHTTHTTCTHTHITRQHTLEHLHASSSASCLRGVVTCTVDRLGRACSYHFWGGLPFFVF